MQSLRRKNSEANGSRPARRPTIGGPTSSAGGARPRPQPKDARKSRVGDKIKKRMSMRYADISEPVGIPDVPSLPTHALRDIRRNDVIVEEEDILDYDEAAAATDRRTRGKAAVTIDKEAMQSTSFDPDACMYFNTILFRSSGLA